ncbi:hypothetical protein DCAR_0418280 [Daucus carota subsp. sativus]|uniref:K Homology domain-containing protein n=1 Tax=Daucus carota subsp. sativus TaxID=79200 RepID=A0A165ZAE9_DAUCS|nr:PREDICTED: KH domain-containing protein At4g18375-like [Daucus carota subsp. sativus]WOG98934.1 hypothetical protein DCAR_0418280 [Daucus carota subsp. sativus]
MSVQLIPTKRKHDRNEPEVRGKWQKTAARASQSLGSPLETTFLRVLCPVSKGDSVISKDGGIILQIYQRTGAMVRVEEIVPGCDERVIVILESDKENGGGSNQNKEGEGKNTSVEGGSEQKKEEEEKNTSDEVGDADEQENDGQDKHSVAAGDAGSEKGPSAAQKALLLVFEKIAEREQETDGGNEVNQKASICTVRLLILSTQLGCILGKGGSVIRQMVSESGAQIRIIPSDKKPVCASTHDDVVQITGSLDKVRRALLCVSQQLLEHPLRGDESLAINTTRPSQSSDHLFPRLKTYPVRNFPFPSQGPPYVVPRDGENGILGHVNPSRYILTFRLLCPAERAGGVVGKGGSIVNTLQQETGCEIKVIGGLDSEDRVIIISGPAHSADRISAPQDGVLRVQARIVAASSEGKEKTAVAKILVFSNQIGCLLGKGGAIITEMRKFTGAYIRIMPKDHIPKCASENEEVIQIKGEFDQVQEALLHITDRLRENFFRNVVPFMKNPSNHAFPDQGPPFLSNMERIELSPPRTYFSLTPSTHKFNVGGPPTHGGFDLHEDRTPLMHNIHRPGFPPHISERMLPAATWSSQGLSEGGGRIGLPDYSGGPDRRMTGSGGGSQHAIITSTTLEVLVPRSAVPAIYGEDGECLKQIREISDAKITITDPKPGAAETAIIISGTPEQTCAAQSLIHAFVISESIAA